MLIKSEKVVVKGKEKQERKSNTTGNIYTDNILYIQNASKEYYELHFVNNMIFTQAEENQEIYLNYYLSPKGQIELNSIEKVGK